ncbi:uncharacterized protein LY89DRAFT_688497 [Mollisia scopiformis]|uniref:Uncharacterized protein n=1 Tax=Mollisia scopiformis TaxID=149040 RepID=A0A194WWG8_MOLSC|nr:uncharacterized protein LY89DRAFT_688497 [Mollisia scopiformis]KUJ12024.1 hypothetical protein LY89DRAFT_688497 [Mollisia scopiformis]
MDGLPQYQKVPLHGVSAVSLVPRPSSRDQHKARKTTVLEKVGTWNSIIIFIGSVIMFGVLSFLWFLWTSNEHNPFWRWLVLNGFLQRAVTLSSAVLRTIITFQASLCTSMIAASLMELSNGFNLLHAASISIKRYNGGLPVLLLQSGIFDRRTWYLLTITILLSSTTIASYFLSTGLVADLGIAPIIGNPVAGTNAYSTNFTKALVLRDYEPDFSIYTPSTYPAFAEYSEPASNIQGIDDTGRVMRAILPISSATTREALSNYTGQGTLLNSHVVCMKPTLENFTLVTGGGVSQTDPLYVRGYVSVGSTIPSGLNFYNYSSSDTAFPATPTSFISFTCSLAKLMNHHINGTEYPISMCVAGNYFGNETIGGGGGEGTTRSPTLGLQATTFLKDDILMDPLSYILVNYTGAAPASYGRKLYTNWTDVSSSDSSWTTLQNVNNFTSELESISLTYCFTNFGSIDTNISVSSTTNRTEPELQGLSSGTNLNADEVLRQLNASGTNLTLEERGVLALNYSNWTGLTLGSQYDTSINSSVTQILGGTYGLGMVYQSNFLSPVQTTWALCTYCAIGKESVGDTNTTGISGALSSIFQSSLQQSGSTANALSAVLTVMNMVQYYTRLQQADIVGNSSTTLIEQQLQPVHRTGLITVTAAIAVHLLIVTVVSSIFLSFTKFSFIGESWHTLAQLQSRDVMPVLQATNTMRDGEVEIWLQERHVSEEKMTLVGRDDEGAHVRRRRVGAPISMI